MDRIGVVGLSWRQADVDALRKFTLDADELDARLLKIAGEVGASELAYIGTCNRVEVVFALDSSSHMDSARTRVFTALSGSTPAPGEANRVFKAWVGEGAVEHLFLVTSGMDSARIGETEITGQVRRSFARSHALGLIGPRLDILFSEALKISAQVQQRTALHSGHVSLAEIALDSVRIRLEQTPGKVALVGVSPMTERCANTLHQLGVPLVIVNRSIKNAEALIGDRSIEARSLVEFAGRPDRIEAIITATGSPSTVLNKATLERMASLSPSGIPPLIVDMAIPRDVNPHDASAVECPYLDMDAITKRAMSSREERTTELADARTLLDDALDRFLRKVAHQRVEGVIGCLQNQYRRTARMALERLLKKELSGLEDAERDAIERWVETLARRFAHIPVMGLRGMARDGDYGGIESFLEAQDSDTARELLASSNWESSMREQNPASKEVES